jgi:N-acetylmuramoyl-L-alanine amidase
LLKSAFRFFVSSYLLFAICYLLTGCATVPAREKLVLFDINGITYFSLVDYCDKIALDWKYDPFTMSFSIKDSFHEVVFRVGDELVLVDDKITYLKHPALMQGKGIIAPLELKEEVLSKLFLAQEPSPKKVCQILKIKKIVIDPGHGGHDPGAISRSGLQEKQINLDIARRLAGLLEKSGIEVVMTRNKDVFISLEKRSEIANRSGADIFISIHANSNKAKILNGFEVYCISTGVSDLKRAVDSARSESNYAGVAFPVKVTLWDMAYNYNRGQSFRLAEYICKVIRRDLDTRVIGVKGAAFQVLKYNNIPAILVEVGFLSNKKEENSLKDSSYRQSIAQAIADGVKVYDKECASMEDNR